VAVLTTFTAPFFLAAISPALTGDPLDCRAVVPVFIAFAGTLVIGQTAAASVFLLPVAATLPGPTTTREWATLGGGVAVPAGGFLVARLSPILAPEAPAVDSSSG
jgi:hypothetical protein